MEQNDSSLKEFLMAISNLPQEGRVEDGTTREKLFLMSFSIGSQLVPGGFELKSLRYLSHKRLNIISDAMYF
jgi:hypothetical protein